MSGAELKAAIEGPARAVGGQVHPDLTARLIRDIGLDMTAPQRDQYDIGKLPLLEYALEQAWKRRIDLQVGLGEYRGLEQALEDRANELYERLSPTEQRAAKRLFVSLVTPGEGREDTRALIAVPEDPATLAVVESFAGTEGRLIVTGIVAGSRSAEVSHEALIQHWDKLRVWIDENRAKLRTRAALTGDRAEWLKHGRHPSLLVQPGLPLEAARELYESPGDVVIGDLKDYVEASFAREARRRFWRGVGFATLAAFAIAMGLLSLFARSKQQEAITNAEKAVLAEKEAQANLNVAVTNERKAVLAQQDAVANETRALAALARVALSEHHATDALKLGLAAWPRGRSDGRPWLETSLNAISETLSSERLPRHNFVHESGVSGALLTKNEDCILTWSDDNTLRLWDVAAGQPIGPAMRHGGSVKGALLTKNEDRILSWSNDNTLRLWDIPSAQPNRLSLPRALPLDRELQPLAEHYDRNTAVDRTSRQR